MDVGEIQNFLRALGCQKISVGTKWVRSTCPMVHLHSGGRDRTPSFAICIEPGDESNCRCQACGIYGGLLPLVWRMGVDGRRPRPDLFDFLVKHNQINVEKLSLDDPEPAPDDIEGQLRIVKKYIPAPLRKSTFVHPDDEPQAEVPEDVLKKMIADMPDPVRAYLIRGDDPIMGVKGRGLKPPTISEWELGWHRFKRRIAIPIRDAEGKLVSISGRTFDDSLCPYCGGKVQKKECLQCGKSPPPKYLHSPFKRDRVLFGEHKHGASNRKGYLFEGFFQTIYTWQCGYANTLASMGTHLSRQQAEKLVRWFDHLIIVPDGDKAGREAAERDRIMLSGLEFPGRPFDPPGKGGTMFRIEQIDIADMPNKKDADTLEPNVLCDILGPRNTT